MTKECWRNVYRARTSIGRSRIWDVPLYQPDRLIEEYDLEPSTEERLAAVARRALRNLYEAARIASSDDYIHAKRGVADALAGLEHLRFLRFGPQSLGIEGLDPEPPRRPNGSRTENKLTHGLAHHDNDSA